MNPIRLKTLRQEAGDSQESLAYRAGVSVATVRRLERGVVGSQTGTAVKLARALNVSVADLFEEPSPKVAS